MSDKNYRACRVKLGEVHSSFVLYILDVLV